jgi:hypothetical protein
LAVFTGNRNDNDTNTLVEAGTGVTDSGEPAVVPAVDYGTSGARTVADTDILLGLEPNVDIRKAHRRGKETLNCKSGR